MHEETLSQYISFSNRLFFTGDISPVAELSLPRAILGLNHTVQDKLHAHAQSEPPIYF